MKHAHLLVLVLEQLQTTTMMPTMLDATLRSLGQHIANK